MDATIVSQLSKDLKDSLERENDVKEQLKFAEEECSTMRKKLTEMEGENESMSIQLRKLSSAKSGRYSKLKSDLLPDDDAVTERETELCLQLELAEQEVKVLKRKVDEIQQDNDNLLCAIKYLRGKMEQRDGTRCSTPFGDAKSTKELLSRIGASADQSDDEAVELKQQLETCQKDLALLKEKYDQLVEEKRLLAAKPGRRNFFKYLF